MSEQVEKRPSREWVKFGILALILLGTIVVVSLARPFIFEHVVPVIMGEGDSSAPAESEQIAPETPVDAAYPAAVEETAPAAAYPAAEQAVDSAASSVESAYPVEDVVVATAVPPISHIVQPGENIIQIAENYQTTVDAIAAANNLTNPNHIEAGMTLEIPQAE